MSIPRLLRRAVSLFRSQLTQLYGPNSVAEHERRISDKWFKSHFVFSADVVNEWMSQAIDVTNARILDFGCGDGIMDLGFVLRHRVKQVIGADVHDSFKFLAVTAKNQIGIEGLPKALSFLQISPGESLASRANIDAAFSWSVFEHIERAFLPRILSDIFTALPHKGIFFLQIEPLYFSPYGSHLSALIKEPWAHLLLSPEELIQRIEASRPEEMSEEQKNKTFEVCSFNDFKQYLIREYQLLNRVTVSELVELVEHAGFLVERKWINHLSLDVPISLLEDYKKEDLTCNEIRLLLGKP